MRIYVRQIDPAAEVGNLAHLEKATLDATEEVIRGDRTLRRSFMQRGYRANGVDDLQGFISRTAEFTLRGRVEGIRCPILLTAAENDPLAAAAEQFHEALTCPKALMRFTAAEGAGGHTGMTNRSLLNQRVLDWPDDTLRPD